MTRATAMCIYMVVKNNIETHTHRFYGKSGARSNPWFIPNTQHPYTAFHVFLTQKNGGKRLFTQFVLYVCVGAFIPL